MYTIGNVIAGPLLAHKADVEGLQPMILCWENMDGHVKYNAIPGVIFAHTEVGRKEKSKKRRISYHFRKFSMIASFRPRAVDGNRWICKNLGAER
ncbi:unnamed protein product [Albugo candida]|uniref:Uncharacterized protein n=1 Tax=Albugo candida TaxID=65357 RepID=A0A024FU62_9STRA|nr:unnamed protein product [Albugo candida]|eukprot:CCI10665.1 unnamed protein product [Albugo candida]